MKPIIKKIQSNIYLIRELDYIESCNCYLIIGTKKCLLIDFGIGLDNIFNFIFPLIKNKELIKVLTHFHFDHFGGTKYFDNILANKIKIKDIGIKYLNEKDFYSNEHYLKAIGNLEIDFNKFIHVKDKETINLGDYIFEIIYTPGHDSSSISLFEKKNKMLFSGDLIYDGEIYHDLKDSNIKDYILSLQKILSLEPKIIYGGHNMAMSSSTIIKKVIQSIQKLNKHK
jgi:glyoxylase-like metal-dependent hydrolase (beta-lactamase superfamily II)